MTVIQSHKAIYFPDYKEAPYKTRTFALAFGSNQGELYSRVRKLSGGDIKQLIQVGTYSELSSKAKNENLSVNSYCISRLQEELNIPFTASVRSDRRPRSRKQINELINQVVEGDCLDVMRSFPSHSIDMVLCDLPYGTTQNQWDSVIPLDKLWAHYERIIKENGVIALTGQGVFSANLILSNSKLFKYKITWVKSKPTNFLNAKKQPLRKHEDICIFYKKQPTYIPQMVAGEPYNKGFRKNQLTGSYGDFKAVEVKSSGERYPTDVVYFKTAESEGKIYHPTQKPVELGRYLIKTFTKPGDVVLDNTCGSGSFLVAAALEGRRWVGIEKNEDAYIHKKTKVDYVKVSRERALQAMEEYKRKSWKLF